MRSFLVFLALVLMAGYASSFVPSSPPHKVSAWTTFAKKAAEEESSFPIFNGGLLDKKESEAAKVAARIKSVKDLGWTQPAKRRGSTRPRHRAYGGQTEEPIQLKANYDESNPRCVEKWLSQEEFNSKMRVSGAVSDTLFVALAGGAAFAEREICEQKIAAWRQPTGKFSEDAFVKTVNQGRIDLSAGWAVFLSICFFCVLGEIFPTNPAMTALVNAVAPLQAQVLDATVQK